MALRDEDFEMTFSWATSLCAFLLLAPESIEMRFEQVAPIRRDASAFVRTPDEKRAVILIHGLLPHPINDAHVSTASLSGWEKPGSMLVMTLGAASDVYSLGYAQNASIDDIAHSPMLAANVNRLRAMGYREIAMIGHSAGALIARYYVEDNPSGGGVSKVIQVSPPNGGSSWGKRTGTVRQSQEIFLTSLTKESRQAMISQRADRVIPPEVQFVCVVGAIGTVGDGVVRADSQWTPDLQRQGIPAVRLQTTHVTAMRSKTVALHLAALVIEPQPRWTMKQVVAAREAIFGKEK
jgi:pimeloyl-ACP methyl ester carboxylesterase